MLINIAIIIPFFNQGAKMLSEQLAIIASNIKTKRQEQNITLNELSKSSKISYSTISAIENGRCTNITIDKLDSIASALNTDFLSLISAQGSPVPSSGTSSDIDEEELIIQLKSQAILNTYYPPKLERHKITSFLELYTILPLLTVEQIYEASAKIMELPTLDGESVSKIYDKLWESVPESDAKKYAQGILNEIHGIRNKNMNMSFSPELIDKKGYKEYKALIKDKLNAINMLKSPLFSRLFSDS